MAPMMLLLFSWPGCAPQCDRAGKHSSYCSLAGQLMQLQGSDLALSVLGTILHKQLAPLAR